MMMEMENYCTECDNVIDAECDEEDFFSHKVGRIKCPKCGTINRPCNECVEHWECWHCPWNNAEVVNP